MGPPRPVSILPPVFQKLSGTVSRIALSGFAYKLHTDFEGAGRLDLHDVTLLGGGGAGTRTPEMGGVYL